MNDQKQHFSSIELDDSRYEDGKYYYAKAKLCELVRVEIFENFYV